MKIKVVRVVIDHDVPQEKVDELVDAISILLEAMDITAVQLVGEEDCEDA